MTAARYLKLSETKATPTNNPTSTIKAKLQVNYDGAVQVFAEPKSRLSWFVLHRRKTKLVLLAIILLCLVPSKDLVGARSQIISERRIIGSSVEGRALEAFRLGDPKGVTVVVVGVIHGDEDAGLLITDQLVTMDIPKGINLWVVPTMNPDGTALDRRGNVNRVDLNRNFPYNWAKMGKPGYWQYAGPGRASEQETKAMVAFMREVKPALGIWYHQDLNIISPGQGLEGKLRNAYSRSTGIPIKRITGGRYTGVAATWQKNSLPNSIAFVVELGKTLNIVEAKVHADAVLNIASLLRDAVPRN